MNAKQLEFDAAIREHYLKVYQEKQNIAYAIVQAINFMILNSKATTQGAINLDLEHCTELLTKTATDQKHKSDRTLLPVISLIRIYRRIAQKVNPHLDIKDIMQEIYKNGNKLAEHILMQPQIIRKFA